MIPELIYFVDRKPVVTTFRCRTTGSLFIRKTPEYENKNN